MRVLFTAHGAYGHVLPLVGVAQALGRRGHAVAVATAPGFCDLVARQGLEAQPAGLDDEAVVAEAHHRWPATRSEPPSAWTVRMFCEIAAPSMAGDLKGVIARWRPDVVVREEGEYGAPVAAGAAGVPWTTHAWGTPLRPPEALVDLGRLVAPLWEQAGLEPPVGGGLYGRALFDPCPPSLYGTPPAVASRRVVRPAAAAGVTSTMRVPAPTGRPLAYVGFGTVPLFRDAPDLVRAVVGALVARGFDVTVTTGDDRLAGELTRMGPGRVTVERWVALDRLLPQCGLVACHGGAGTVLSALAAGVPLLLLPRGAPSQARMSAACASRGVGRQVVWDGTNADEVAGAVDDITSDDRFRTAAAAVAREIAAMPDPSTAADTLAAVVGHSS